MALGNVDSMNASCNAKASTGTDKKQPETKQKATSISAMLQKPRNKLRKAHFDDHRNVTSLDHRPNSHKEFARSKVIGIQGLSRVVQTRRMRKSPPHSLSKGLEVTTSAYRNNVGPTHIQLLGPAHEKLVARLDDSSQTTESLASVRESVRDLTAPLAKDILDVRFKSSNGQVVHQQIALGVTVATFEHKVGDKRQELEGLWHEWTSIQQQISDLRDELVSTANRSDAIDRTAKDLLDLMSDNLMRSTNEVESESREEADKRKVQDQKWQEFLKAAT